MCARHGASATLPRHAMSFPLAVGLLVRSPLQRPYRARLYIGSFRKSNYSNGSRFVNFDLVTRHLDLLVPDVHSVLQSEEVKLTIG